MQFPTIPLVLVGHCGAGGGGGVFDKQGQGLTVELRKLGVFFFKVEQALSFYLFFLGTLHEYEC